MQQVIHLLPDHIANQIAAGEVVQRPASVVKELLENAIDAGASRIELVIKDAGKELIQVIDNGQGMSSQDARMAFERHATSKIKEAGDLFNIRTMGFRGEAMASIAAVAQVSMRTRLHDAELGTLIHVEGSKVRKHEPVMCAPGTCVEVKNLFYNVPARRNFLKSNPVETRHILAEFIRVALALPEMTMRLDHNGTQVYNLSASDLERRIVDLFGKAMDGKLIEVGEDTPYVSMSGFIGLPEAARKKRGEQYFFVNRRFIKSGYLHHAVSTAFAGLIPEDAQPFYCIFFQIDPEHIDINIHPTKTEIKFDDERTVYQLLHSVIRKGLGDFHQAPNDLEDQAFLRILAESQKPSRDETTIGQLRAVQPPSRPRDSSPQNWGDMYPSDRYSRSEKPAQRSGPGFLFPEQNSYRELEQAKIFEEEQKESDSSLMQVGQRYILVQGTEGLRLIDQRHAHQRILYERFRNASSKQALASQQLLFPRTLHFSPVDFSYLREISEEVRFLGFDLHEFGPNTFILHGVPALLKGSKAEQFFEDIIAEVRESGAAASLKEMVRDALAKAIAMKTAMPAGKRLNILEMRNIVDTLLACEQPGLSPAGRPTTYRLEWKDLEQFFTGKVN